MPSRSNVCRFALSLACSCLFQSVLCSLVAVSQVEQCVQVAGEDPEVLNRDGEACGKKLVVALTVSGNESKAQYLEANISLVTNESSSQRMRIKKPFRISIQKSPVTHRHRLHYVGTVNHKPHEETIGQLGGCRDDWFAGSASSCGYQYSSSGEAIFDSQGFCCPCHIVGTTYWRAASASCHGTTLVAHCMRKHWLNYRVFDLHPPVKEFRVAIVIQELDYARTDGTEVWVNRATLEVGPHRTVVKSNTLTVKVEYIGDLATTTYSHNLQSKYLLVPALDDVSESHRTEELYRNMTNTGNWLLVDRHLVDLSGAFCDKIGTDYRAFRNQPGRCIQPRESCLQGQPHHLYSDDLDALSEGRKGYYLVKNFGRFVPALPTTTVLDFLSTNLQKSMVIITMEADELQSVVNTAPGRIVDMSIEPFEALSMDGLLTVLVENTGSISAAYQVSVVHCSAGIEYVPAQSVVMDPAEVANLTFVLYSFHSISQINDCEVQLYDEKGVLWDNQTVSFTTFDTCFCHGFCGCSCGSNASNCPAPPDMHDSVVPQATPGIIKFFENLGGLLQTNLAAMIIGYVVIQILLILGVIKVIIMIASGEINIPGLWLAIGAVGMANGVPMFATNMVRDQLTMFADHGQPARCDGMCKGAKKARNNHRKRLRINERKGIKAKEDDVWWKHPYMCTCQVRETKSMLEIIKGTCFFIYCPILPLWWVVEFAIELIKRKVKRNRRREAYRKAKVKKMKAKAKEFLSMDDYVRGKTTKKKLKRGKRRREERLQEVMAMQPTLEDIEDGFNDLEIEEASHSPHQQQGKGKQKKKKKKQKPSKRERAPSLIAEDEVMLHHEAHNEAEGRNEEPLLQQDDLINRLGQLSDGDETPDIHTLLQARRHIYFNYDYFTDWPIPESLQEPGPCFSIRGRLRMVSGDCVFDLHRYVYQTHRSTGDERVPLDEPHKLTRKHFEQVLDVDTALALVTLTPLYPCINTSKRS